MNTPTCIRAVFFVAVSLLLLASASAQDSQQGAKQNFPWMNKNLSPDERADMVLKQMTLDEKMDLLHGKGMRAWGTGRCH